MLFVTLLSNSLTTSNRVVVHRNHQYDGMDVDYDDDQFDEMEVEEMD